MSHPGAPFARQRLPHGRFGGGTGAIPNHAVVWRVPTAAIAAALMILAGPLPQAADHPIRFTDVADQAGIDINPVPALPTPDFIGTANGTGAAWLDYDNDRDLDALIVRASTVERLRMGGDPLVALFRNDGASRFTDVTRDAGLERNGWGSGVCVADVDNDGFQDVYVTAIGPNVLWRNTGRGTFELTGEADDARWSTGCAFGDYDRDGHVDLYVANYLQFDLDALTGQAPCRFMNIDVVCGPRPLPGERDILYRNTGEGRFEEVTAKAGVTEPGYYGFGVLFSDLDDDGWPDIYVANDSLPNLYFRNEGDATFTEIGLESGAAVSDDGREQASMGVDAGDYDGDGRLDLVTTNFAQDYTTLYRNYGDGVFRDVSFRSGMAATLGPYLGWGIGFVDLDNDGRLDLFAANGHVYPEVDRTGTSTFEQINQVFWNAGDGRFRDVTREVGGALAVEASSRGAAFGDYDVDGDIDVLVVNIGEPPALLRNDSERRHWITIRLVGDMSNRDAIGAKVTVEAGGRRQVAEVRSGGSYVSHNDMRIHYGLGDTGTVDEIRIRWPSGHVDVAEGIAADRFYVATEGGEIAPEPRP